MANGSAASGPRNLTDRPTRTTKKRISDEEWQMHKENIERLYLDEGRDVREVRDTMKREYSFDAHEKAYKRKFEEWGLIKNIPKEEGLFMVKKRERRREEEGKETIFRRRRRPDGPLQLVLDEKVDRIGDRYSHDLNNYPEHPATPDNIEYETPHGTPREERHSAHPPHPQPLHHDQQPARPQASIATSNSEWAFAPIAPLQAPGPQHHEPRQQYYVQDQPNLLNAHHQPPPHAHQHAHHSQHPAHLPHPQHHQHPQHPNALPHPLSHPQAHPQHAQHPTHPQHAPHPQHSQHPSHPQHPQHAPHPQHPAHGHPQHPQHAPPPGQPHGNWDPWGHPYF